MVGKVSMANRKQNLRETIVELFDYLILLDQDIDSWDGFDDALITLQQLSDHYRWHKSHRLGNSAYDNNSDNLEDGEV